MLILSKLRHARGAILALSLCLLSPLSAFAHGVKVGDLELHHPWTRATPDGADAGGGFLVIKNTGAVADRLVGGSADFAAEVQIHEMKMEGEVMKMHQIEGGLEIPPGAEVVLKPGSYHVMFMGLNKALKEGGEVAGTLTFEKAGTVNVEWSVEAIGAKAPAGEGQ